VLKNNKNRSKKLFYIIGAILALTGIAFFISNSFSQETYVISSLSKGLVGHWSMDDMDYDSSNSRISDKSSFENHGTNYGATFTEDRFGKESGSMSFSSGNRINTLFGNNYDVGLNSLSFSMWLKPNTTSGSEMFAAFGTNTDNRRAYFAKYNGKWDMGIRASGWGTAQHNVTTDWTHITVVFNGNNNIVTMYVNSEFSIQKSYTDYNLLDNLTIGAYGNGGYQFFGLIDDVRIYNRALSETEIKSLYDTYNPKTTTGSLQKGLVLDMPLKSKYTKSEVGGSEIMTDRTPYSNDGQNYGATVTNEGAIMIDNSDPGEYINVPYDFSNFSQLTLSIWAKTNYSGGQNLFKNSPFILHFRGAGFYLRDNSGGVSGYLGWNYSLQNDNWYHLVGIWDGSMMKTYINGNQTNSQDWTGSGILNNSSSFSIGKYFNSSQVSFSGMLSNALIYNRALSDGEVKTLYDRGRSDAGIIFQPEN
jgi:hypothetical protein